MPIQKTTRDQLIKVAYNHFSKFGYHATSLQKLMDAAHMAKSSLYHHFKSKEEVLIAALKHAMQHWEVSAQKIDHHIYFIIKMWFEMHEYPKIMNEYIVPTLKAIVKRAGKGILLHLMDDLETWGES